MKQLVTRGLRIAVTLRTGGHFTQVFEITAADAAACERAAESYVRGACAILALLSVGEVMALDVSWAPIWDATQSLVSA